MWLAEQEPLPALSPSDPCARSNPAWCLRTGLLLHMLHEQLLFQTQGGAVIAEAVPDPYDGYSFILKPGTYVVDISHAGN